MQNTSLWYVLPNELLALFVALSVTLIAFPSVMKALFVMLGSVLDQVGNLKEIPATMNRMYEAERVNRAEQEESESEVFASFKY
jgi:hypothetical protein